MMLGGLGSGLLVSTSGTHFVTGDKYDWSVLGGTPNTSVYLSEDGGLTKTLIGVMNANGNLSITGIVPLQTSVARHIQTYYNGDKTGTFDFTFGPSTANDGGAWYRPVVPGLDPGANPLLLTCVDGFERVNGTCVPKCAIGFTRNTAGDCAPPVLPKPVEYPNPTTCATGFSMVNGHCEVVSSNAPLPSGATDTTIFGFAPLTLLLLAGGGLLAFSLVKGKHA